jgi:hypothetical protein
MRMVTSVEALLSASSTALLLWLPAADDSARSAQFHKACIIMQCERIHENTSSFGTENATIVHCHAD